MPIATPQGTLDFKSVDKVTFVGTSSNTVIDTTTGSLGVGVGVNGPTSNLHVVGNTRLEGDINMLHTSNTASIKLNSNVVTEFPRSKKLIKYPRVVLTANGLNQGYTVSGSNEYSSGLTYYGAFTPPTTLSTPSGAWLTPTSGTTGYSASTGDYLLSEQLHNESLTGEFVQIVLPERINPVYFTVQPRPESANNNQGLLSCIKEGEIWASNNNGTTWTLVGTIQNFTPTDLYQQYIVNDINVTGYYDTFALIIHKNNGQTFAGVGEWKIFGLPEYDPEAHGTDVVVKSAPNVPNTDWLEVYYDAKDLTSVSGTIADLSGKSVAGTLNGDVSLDTSNNVKSFSFDGSGDYISGTLTNTGDFDFTVSAWINRNVTGSDHTIWQIGLGSNSNNPNASTCLSISNEQLDYFIFSGPSVKVLDYADKYPTQTWVHIVCERVGNELSIYINGKIQTLDYSGTPSDTLSIVSNSTFHIGARTGTQLGVNPMNGKIANFRLFNRALTSDEIWQLYAYQKEYFGHGDLSMTLKAGRLGIGTSEPRAALDVRGDLFGPGVVQVRSTTFDGITSGSSSSFITLSGLTTSITPKRTGSKILVLLNLFWSGQDDAYFQGNVKKDGTVLVKQEGSVGSASKTSFAMLNYVRGQYFLGNIGFSYLDDTNIGTEPIEYTVEVRNRAFSSQSWYINYTSDTADANRLTGVSTLTLIEIQQ